MGKANHVIFPFRGAEIGGSHVSAFTLATALQAVHSIHCTVLCAADTQIAAEAVRRGFSFVPTNERPTRRGSLASEFHHYSSRRGLLSEISGGRGAIVHCNDIESLLAWGPASKGLALPVLFHHRALNRMWLPHNFASLSLADAIVCISDATASSFALDKSKVVKILNPFTIDESVGRAASRTSLLREFRWPEEAVVIGWVGNFWWRKRPEFFLEAAKYIAEWNSACRFVMFGREGDARVADLKSIVSRYGLTNLVEFPGFRSPVEPCIAALDLLIAPAASEPFGRTLVEALLLGTPILATRGAGHTEILERWRGGVLADASVDAAAAAQIAQRVILSPEQAVLTTAERGIAKSDLSAESHAVAIVAVYEQLLGSRS